MREKITFEERVQVQLDKDEAKPMPSRNGGTEYMRVCDGDTRIMFAPPALEAAIKDSGARAGDIIQIDKLTRGRNVAWEVAIVSETPAPARRTSTQPAARPAAPAPAAREVQQAAAVSADKQTAAYAAAMASAFHAALLATGEAEEHASRIGMRDVRFSDKETVTRVALSIFIAGQKEGRA